jgi:hypothetical protein
MRTVRADVCVVGGGFTGLWSALSHRSLSDPTQVVADGAVECDPAMGGGLIVATSEAQLREVVETVAGMEAAGRGDLVRPLPADEARRMSGIPEATGGYLLEHAGARPQMPGRRSTTARGRPTTAWPSAAGAGDSASRGASSPSISTIFDRTQHGMPWVGGIGRHRNIHHGGGYAGHGVVPSHVMGRTLASVTPGLDDDSSRSPLVSGPPSCLPIEPIGSAGAHLVRGAVIRCEEREDAVRVPDPASRAPRRALGLTLPKGVQVAPLAERVARVTTVARRREGGGAEAAEDRRQTSTGTSPP